MKAMVAVGYGSPEVYQLRNVEKPIPKANEILVKVRTSSATRADAMMRTGKPLIARLFVGLRKPKNPIPGTGFAGEVESLGTEVKKYKVGDRVFGETTFGFSSNAEYVTISEDSVVLPLPENMDFSEASNFCDGHLTSYNFIKEIANIRPGQSVLINGASGSLGTSAVQISKYLGAKVTGVCSTANVGLVKSLGADNVVDYRREDYTLLEERYDYIFDTVGKSSFRRSKKVLKPSGVYLSPVLQFPLFLAMLWTTIYGKRKAKFAATGTLPDHKLLELLKEVLEIYKKGKLKTIVDRQYPLEKLAEAHRYIDTGRKKGNVVIYNH